MTDMTFPMISFAISIVLLVVQALLRYGIAKQEEVVRARFGDLDREIAGLKLGIEKLTTQQSYMHVAVELVKSKQQSDAESRAKHETYVNEIRSQMVSKEIFETRIGGLEHSIFNLSKAQTDVLAEVMRWLNRRDSSAEHTWSEEPPSRGGSRPGRM